MYPCYEQGRFGGFKESFMKFPHLDTKYFESWEKCLLKKKKKVLWDFFQDFGSLVLQKIGHSLANRQARVQPL